MTSPKVVIMNKYTPSYKNLNFTYDSKQKVYNSTMNMFDYYSDNKKKAFFMLDYFSGKIGKDKEMNIIFENGEYATKSEIEKRKVDYTKYIENSNIYKLVISFPENYLEENVDIKELEKAMAKDIVPQFLKKCGFQDMKKMSYQFSLHTNTDNLHFHLSFAEKSPNYLSYGKIQYRHNGELTQEELNFFKNEILHYIEKEKIFTPLLKETNQELESLKKYFNPKDKNFLLRNKDDIIMEEKILKLGELINEKRENSNQRIKFNSIKDKEIVKLTKEIKKAIFSKENNNFKDEYNEFKNTLREINEYFTNIAEDNHGKVDDTLIKNKNKYFDNYVLNAIVNHANYIYRKSKIYENDIIGEIVYKEYKRNKKRTRYDILSSFLSSKNKSNQFKNKYQVMQAVKNINYELEEAEKEFEKLFKIDKEYE